MAQLAVAAAGAAVGSLFGAPQVGWLVGSFIGGELFGGQGGKVEGPRLGDLQVQASTYLTSAVLPVIAGDWFELALYIGSSGELKSSNRTWFAIDLVETEDAANPPYDFSWPKEGQPGPSEVVLRQVVARRVRLEADFAGSVGVAGTAATADADFDVQRNGSSIGTIRFGTGATAPTFIAAAGVTLEIGDELIVVAPMSLDTSLSDFSITIAGDLLR